VAVAALVLALVTGHLPSLGQLTANQQPNQDLATVALGTYPGQQPRGVLLSACRSLVPRLLYLVPGVPSAASHYRVKPGFHLALSW
jgi:hypothetical protein